MVSHKKKDYGYEGDPVGHKYEDWAEEMMSSDEDDNQQRASGLYEYLEHGTDPDLSVYTDRQRAAGGGVMVASQLSERLRTDYSKGTASKRGRAALVPISTGEATWTDIYSSSSARYYPARDKGSGRERSDMRGDPRTPDAMDVDDYLSEEES